jgi:spermidine synthase
MTFEPMVKHIPVGQSGKAEIQHFHVGEKERYSMVLREAATKGREVATPMGDYCRLLINGQIVMSDTYLEELTNREVVYQTRGHVLIAGLGLGYILVPMLHKETVRSITVIEKHQDVIDLVGPRFKDRRLTILLGDIFKWKPEKGASYDVIYFDIWPAICSTNLKDMARLERRFRPFKSENGWMGSWAKTQCRRQ